MSKSIDKLIINNPYEEPKKHWLYNREDKSFLLQDGRRNSGYWKSSAQRLDENDPGEFVEIKLVNIIKEYWIGNNDLNMLGIFNQPNKNISLFRWNSIVYENLPLVYLL